MDGFLTIPKVARLLGVREARVRHALTKLDEPPERAGRVAIVPADWLPAIRHAIANDRRRKTKKPRVRLRLTD
jgi:hypothetical protein